MCLGVGPLIHQAQRLRSQTDPGQEGGIYGDGCLFIICPAVDVNLFGVGHYVISVRSALCRTSITWRGERLLSVTGDDKNHRLRTHDPPLIFCDPNPNRLRPSPTPPVIIRERFSGIICYIGTFTCPHQFFPRIRGRFVIFQSARRYNKVDSNASPCTVQSQYKTCKGR